MDAERKDLELLMAHFRRCCLGRLQLWLKEPVAVEATSTLGFRVRHKGQSIDFDFRPGKSLWSLSVPGESTLEGDFDHLTKRARQILTLSP